MLAERSPEICRAVGLLKELSADEAIRMQYEAREKALRDDKARIRFAEKAAAERARYEGIEIGRGEGIEIGRGEGIEIGRGEGIEIGRGEGIEIGQHKMARNLLALGVEPTIISTASGLSLAEIQSLQAQMT